MREGGGKGGEKRSVHQERERNAVARARVSNVRCLLGARDADWKCAH